jgi:hypothetical protein
MRGHATKRTTKRSTEKGQKKVDRRDVHPYPLRVSGDIVPSGPPGFPHGTEPFVSAPTIDLVRPLSLTEEPRLCQNIEHYQLSI